MKRHAFPTKQVALRALLIAPLLPTAILFLLDATDRVMQFGLIAILGAAMFAFYTLVIMEIFALAVGGLILAALWRRVPFNILIFLGLGGLVASLPLLALLSIPQPASLDAWYNGQSTVIDGHKTAYGYYQDAIAVGQVFLFGAIGGAFFWWLCRPSKHGYARNDD